MSKRGENIYKRKDGRWEGRYQKGRNAQGKIKYGYIYGKNYSDVKRRLYEEKVRYQIILKEQGISANSFEHWTQDCLGQLSKSIKKSTYASYQHKLNKYINPEIGMYQLNELTKENIEDAVKHWETLGLAPSSIQLLHRLIHRLLEMAIEQNLLVKNPSNKITLPKRKKRKTRALSLNDQIKLETVANRTENPKIIIPLYLGLYAGLRIGEIAALKWKDVHFDSGIIEVNSTLQRIPLKTTDRKTQIMDAETKSQSSNRIVPITETLKEQLILYVSSDKEEYILNHHGKPCEPRIITYHFHKLIDKASMSGLHFHQLRHTFATRCIESNGDIASLSALLGHSSTKMTLDVYTDTMLEQRFQVVYDMESKIEKART